MKETPLKELFRNELRVNLQRYSGLVGEVNTVKVRWENLSRFLMDKRILPDTPAFKEARDYLNMIKDDFHTIDETLNRGGRTTRKIKIMQIAFNRIHYTLERVYRLLAFVKTAYRQRTDSLEIPYVLAGLSRTPEEMWGGELFIIAADKLVQNYAQQLIMHGRWWDRFTSYYPLHPELEESPGALYTPFRKTFHLTLANDMKHFIPGYISLAHEVGHAACESTWTSIGKSARSPRTKKIPRVLYNFLDRLFAARRLVWSQLKKSLKNRECNCEYFKYFREASTTTSHDGFIWFTSVEARDICKLLFNQILPDVVALVIAGPNYLRSLFDYVFECVLDYENPDFLGKAILRASFWGLLIRISTCVEFANRRGIDSKWNFACRALLAEIGGKTENLLTRLSRTQRRDCMLCYNCSRKTGELLGQIISSQSDTIFANLFKPNSTFQIKKKVAGKLRRRQILVDEEPRNVIHAFCELRAQDQNIDPATRDVFSCE